jgi:hypothetical protein
LISITSGVSSLTDKGRIKAYQSNDPFWHLADIANLAAMSASE